MNENKVRTAHEAACITASCLLESIENICDRLNSCDTAEEMKETAGTSLGEVSSLIGSAHLLLIDIDALIKSGD